jgi:hypothetical protein
VIRTASLLPLALITAALTASCSTHTTTNHPSAPPAVSGSPTAPAAGSTSAAAIARVFATAYGRYLDGHAAAAALPDATTAARAQAGAIIPPARRAGPLTVQSVQPIPAGERFVIALRDRAHLFTAQLTLAALSDRWVVVAVAPADLDTMLAPTPPAIPPPAGSAPAEHAARTFISGYLTWLYGHAPLRAVRTATLGLLAGFKAHPPRVPPTIQALRATVEAIGMQRRGRGWQALANISDGQQTYELELTIAHTHTHRRWLISNVSSPR